MYEKLIRKIAERLDEDKIPYMIIGGQAVLAYGRVRLTLDIDITLGIDTDGFALAAKVCEKLGLRMLPSEPEEFAGETNVLPTEEPKSRIRVDFVFSFSEYEREALKRTTQIAIEDYPVKFASREDVIIHKMVAGRAIDLEDVKVVLIKNRESVDLEYIAEWLEEFSRIPEHAKILEQFDRLLSESSGG